MWNITLRNIQFRRRQFLIVVVGTSLVFGMALLVTGIREGFRSEAQKTLDGIGGDHWVIPRDTSGPFTAFSIVEARAAETLAGLPGVRQADPIVLLPQTIGKGEKAKTINVIGRRNGGLGQPPLVAGRTVQGEGDAVVDKKVDLKLGERFALSGRKFTVVGLVTGRTYFGGTPTIYVGLKDAQALAYRGNPYATAIVMNGRPAVVIPGLSVLSKSEVKADLLRPLRDAEQSINNTRLLLWLVAAIIVGAVMYMSALERVRDFAILKAVGAGSRVLVTSLAIEAVIACLLSAALAVFVARLLRPIIPLPVTYTASAYALLPVVAVIVGMLSSLSGVRRAVRTDPAAVFAGRDVSDLEIRDLVIEYTQGDYLVRPIDSLNVRVSDGDLVILLGPSGSGKTTLLSCLAGILTPTGGSIRFGDVEVTALHGGALAEYRRHTVGIVFQAFNLIPSLNVRENVMAPLRLAGIPARVARPRAEELLTMVGLEDRMDHRPKALSGGQQQRVAIVRALVHEPSLVVADEPTAHLDYVQVEEVLRIVRDLAVPGRMVVIATHDERLIPLADRTIELLPKGAPTERRPPSRLPLEAGQVLFEQGIPSDFVYVVDEGEIELLRDRADKTRETVRVVGPGGYFGELGPLLGLPRSASARARTAAVVTAHSPREFKRLSKPDSAQKVASPPTRSADGGG